jgi:hypothetical protein
MTVYLGIFSFVLPILHTVDEYLANNCEMIHTKDKTVSEMSQLQNRIFFNLL